jgi:hypothetical protein
MNVAVQRPNETTGPRRGSAGDDISRENAAISKDEVTQWARHAHAANGFGDDTDETRPASW